jgi:PAS domain S-box-containing protein
MHKDGQRIDVSTAISPVKDADGKILGAAAITRNISDRKKAEERFYKAFNANPEPITIASLADGRYIDVNESFLRITGSRREEVIGRTSLEVKFWERAEDRAGLIKTLQEHGSVRDLEITFLTKSGEQRIGLNSAEIIEIGGEQCVISIFRDMTEQRILERKMLRC